MIAKYKHYIKHEFIQQFSLWWILCFTITAASRLWLTIDGHGISSMRAYVSDGLVSSLPALIFALLPFATIRTLLVFLWCTIVASNMEHIIVNIANVSASMWGYAMDESFIFGSLLTKSIFVHTILFYALISIAYYVLHSRTSHRLSAHYFYPAAAFLVLFIGLIVLPVSIIDRNWQQMNVAEDNAFSAWYVNRNVPNYFADQGMPANVYPYYVKDLTGSPLLPLGEKRNTNVLMVVIEGLGEAHLKAGWMPNLERIRSFGLDFSQYINASTFTMNGMYALFCGDYPQMQTAQVTINYSSNPPALLKNDFKNHPCLPARLREAGYTTAFLQAARLSFAKKGDFMMKAGFEEVYGMESFGEKVTINKWGVSDKELINRAMEKTTELSKLGKPWFLTVFNVGTHHPYDNMPEDFMPELNGLERAMRYMDIQLNELIGMFQRSGLTNNTMLIITNDETHVSRNIAGQFINALSDNQGFMLILTPEMLRHDVEEPFMQNDLMVSMLDYLGLDTEGTIGRSMFRKYSDDRPLYFGNTQGNRLYIKPDKDSIILCHNADICQLHEIESKNIFHSALKKIDRQVGNNLAHDIMWFNDERYKHWLENKPR